MAKTIMIQGTGSSVGKSVLTAAFCRIFLQDGFKVSPFKAQNMSLNSFVTTNGGEMGRAQVLQAQAAKILPHTDMNPVLIKPTSHKKAQIILQGQPQGNMSAASYHIYKKKIFGRIIESFKRIEKQYELIVLEGAGSPAEVNLKINDVVNMAMACKANAPVILVGDIDKGGVFASIAGTLELLNKKERAMETGFIINKFRGDKKLLTGGIKFLEKKTGKPVLGIVPYFNNIKISEEDSTILEYGIRNAECDEKNINIAIVKLPYISNFTDFDALSSELDVNLYYVKGCDELGKPDVIIITGTKNTIADLIWLKKFGLAAKILSTAHSSLPTTIVGICGGYQILGEKITDFSKLESRYNKIKGLGLLAVATSFKSKKTLHQVEAEDIKTGIKVTGYEIHHGETINLKQVSPVFEFKKEKRFDGAKSKDGRIWGTYIHGVFDEPIFRRDFLNRIRKDKGLESIKIIRKVTKRSLQDAELDKLAALVRKNIDMKLLYKILNA